MGHLVAHLLGLDNPTGAIYLSWSGWVGNLSLLGGVAVLYHKHNCHQARCWRVGKHVVDGTPFCTKHHPTAPPVGGS